ncbi:MAG: flagellar protein FlgN [Microbacteriaceae bacterium]|nr:MAG: flagellar protein FlgN [Microbacteriaceae bacterium]
MNANGLSTVLWRERELLELLVFKLEEQQLLLSAGKSQWLRRASDEVRGVADRLAQLGLSRAITVGPLEATEPINDQPSLQEIIDELEEPVWRDIFSAHLGSLRTLTAQVRALQEGNIGLIRAALRSTQETLAAADVDASTYDASGRSDDVPVGARLIDRDI